MREVNEAVKATILREFTAREAELSEVHATKRWNWNGGVVLFPEGICPWCKESIQSHSIWVVRDNQLLGRWSVVNGRLVREARADHPHVKYSTGGQICIGTSDSYISALFFGMNPGDVFWNKGGSRSVWSEWLKRVWDHNCNCMCDHANQEKCRLLYCGTSWVEGVAGCACGCGCHPSSGGCGCGCEECRCDDDEPDDEPDDGLPYICECEGVEDGTHCCSVCCNNYNDQQSAE